MGPLVLHASCVALSGAHQGQGACDLGAQHGFEPLRGVLIKGPSGSGKSGLALEMMARGAVLVADDRVEISRREGVLWASAPKTIAGLIEARGLGILRAQYVAEVQLHAIVDMTRLETERLPGHLMEHLLDVELPRVNPVDSPFFAASLIQYVKGGAVNPDDGLSSL